MRETGCRRGEALQLRHEQVRRDERRVLLTRTKGGRWHYLFLTKAALAAIDYIPRVCEWVWFNPKTMQPWHDLRKPWGKARKAAGYPWLKPKDLRRFYAIRLAESGSVEMHHIQAALAHASVRTTEQHYAHYSDRSTEKRAAESTGRRQEGIMHYTVPATHVEAGAAPESRGEISTTKPSPEWFRRPALYPTELRAHSVDSAKFSRIVPGGRFSPSHSSPGFPQGL